MFFFGRGIAAAVITIGWRPGSFSLNGDGDVSRYPMLMSVFHGRSIGRASLFCLSLLSFLSSFQNSSIVLSLHSSTAFCLVMNSWHMFFFFLNTPGPEAGLVSGQNGFLEQYRMVYLPENTEV